MFGISNPNYSRIPSPIRTTLLRPTRPKSLAVLRIKDCMNNYSFNAILRHENP
jgi:hypothetical protein